MGSAGRPGQHGDVLGRVSAALEIDRDTLDLFYALEVGEPQILISRSKIAQNKALDNWAS